MEGTSKNQNVNFQPRFGIAFAENEELEDDVITIENDDISDVIVNSDIIEGKHSSLDYIKKVMLTF